MVNSHRTGGVTRRAAKGSPMAQLEYAPDLPAPTWGRFQRVESDAGERLVRSVPTEPVARAMALRHAWRMTRNLELPLVLAPSEIERGETQITLVYPDAAPTPLSAVRRPDTTVGLIKRALELTRAVEQLHDAGIVHRGVRPDAFLVELDGVRISVLDHATRATTAQAEIVDPAGLSDRLPFVAPEQTGRLNRPLDHRVDLYGLGVTLYWLFSGDLPFTARDPMGWIHAHLARRPRPINTVPQGLSKLALRLLAKDPESRYQSASGVRADLEAALAQLESAGHLDAFAPSAFQQSDRFQLPTGLYGREVEMEVLQAGFEACRRAAAVAYVTGDPGIGKSRLIHELLRTVTAEGGYFVEGKADQYRRARPFDALLDAVDDLVRQVAMRPAAEVAALRDALREALRDNTSVVVDAVPSALWLLGRGSPTPKVGPDEAELRFRLTLSAFLRVFADSERPLVLFLDDLQWVDRPTLGLLRQLLTVDAPPRAAGDRRLATQRGRRGASPQRAARAGQRGRRARGPGAPGPAVAQGGRGPRRRRGQQPRRAHRGAGPAGGREDRQQPLLRGPLPALAARRRAAQLRRRALSQSG